MRGHATTRDQRLILHVQVQHIENHNAWLRRAGPVTASDSYHRSGAPTLVQCMWHFDILQRFIKVFQRFFKDSQRLCRCFQRLFKEFSKMFLVRSRIFKDFAKTLGFEQDILILPPALLHAQRLLVNVGVRGLSGH